jgi:membrane-bound metal-dependent hydrolase YbcI (DUF457 family)
LGLGVGAEFLAEALKFMAGAALPSFQNLRLLYSYDPTIEVWNFIKDILLITIVVSVLVHMSVQVGRGISKILGHRGETAILIISILIMGLILEEIDQRKFQEEWQQRHSQKNVNPATERSRQKDSVDQMIKHATEFFLRQVHG